MARPRKVIDWPTVDKLCAIHCTCEEIAGILNVSVDTLERAVKREHKMTFAVYFEQKAAHGRMSLRRKQYELAAGGNATMLIWLGKQWLGQKDKNAHEHSGPDGRPIETKSSTDMTDEQLEAKIASLTRKDPTP